jgi:hypothetical protein
MKTEMKILVVSLSMIAAAIAGFAIVEDVDAAENWWEEVSVGNEIVDTEDDNIEEIDYETGVITYFVKYKGADGKEIKITYTASTIADIDLFDGWKNPKNLVVSVVDPFNGYSLNAEFPENKEVYNIPESPLKKNYVKVVLTGSFSDGAGKTITLHEDIYAEMGTSDWQKYIIPNVQFFNKTTGKFNNPEFVYNGSKQTAEYKVAKYHVVKNSKTSFSLVIDEYFSTQYYKVTGNSGTNAKEYTAKASLIPKDGVLDTIFGSKNLNWVINSKSVNDLTIKGKVTLDGDNILLRVWDTETGKDLVRYPYTYNSTINPYVAYEYDYVITNFSWPDEDDEDRIYSATIAGIDKYFSSKLRGNYIGERTFVYSLINIEGFLNVNTISGTGSINAETFDGKIFVFPLSKPYGEPIPSDGYFITVKDGWGQLVFTNNPAELEMAKSYGVAQTYVTTSEWNYIELNGNEDNGYFGCVSGSFYMEFNGGTPGLIFNDAGNKVIGYNGESTNVVIPAMNNGVKVTKIANKAFYNNKTIESVVIGDNVTHIGMKAFANCVNLKSIVIGDSVKVIYSYAFFGCNNIEDIDFGCKLIDVQTKAFGSVTFRDASGKKIDATAENLRGMTFVGSNKVLKLVD